MDWGIGITTAPRPSGNDLLTPTVQSLKAAGWDDCNIYVFMEPNSIVTEEEVVTVHNGTTLGAWRNWRRSLERLLELEPDAKMYALIQDDLKVRPGLRSYLERNTVGPPALYSPYTSKREHKPGADGWFKSTTGWNFCGACFYVMHPAVVAYLDAHLPDTVRGNLHIDAHVASHLVKSPYPLLCHGPSLIEHMADADSTLGYKAHPAIRTASGFIDEPIE